MKQTTKIVVRVRVGVGVRARARVGSGQDEAKHRQTKTRRCFWTVPQYAIIVLFEPPIYSREGK